MIMQKEFLRESQVPLPLVYTSCPGRAEPNTTKLDNSTVKTKFSYGRLLPN